MHGAPHVARTRAASESRGRRRLPARWDRPFRGRRRRDPGSDWRERTGRCDRSTDRRREQESGDGSGTGRTCGQGGGVMRTTRKVVRYQIRNVLRGKVLLVYGLFFLAATVGLIRMGGGAER